VQSKLQCPAAVLRGWEEAEKNNGGQWLKAGETEKRTQSVSKRGEKKTQKSWGPSRPASKRKQAILVSSNSEYLQKVTEDAVGFLKRNGEKRLIVDPPKGGGVARVVSISQKEEKQPIFWERPRQGIRKGGREEEKG